MKYIAKINPNNLSLLRTWTREMWESNSYYGARGSSGEWYAGADARLGLHILTDGEWVQGQVNHTDGTLFPAVGSDGIHGGRWTTSAGNVFEWILLDDGQIRVRFEGRRHGIKFPSKLDLEGAVVEIYETQCPDASPMECGLTVR